MFCFKERCALKMGFVERCGEQSRITQCSALKLSTVESRPPKLGFIQGRALMLRMKERRGL